MIIHLKYISMRTDAAVNNHQLNDVLSTCRKKREEN